MRRLTQDELKERSAKGLCWHCDEKWQKGYHCKQKRLVMIEPVEDLEEAGDKEESEHDGDVEEGIEQTVAISVHTLVRYSTPTMQVNGSIKHQPITILIDLGSTNNFLDVKIAKRLLLSVEQSKKFDIKIADGRSLPSTRKYSNVKISIQSHIVTIDLFLLPLNGYDIVLGAQWL